VASNDQFTTTADLEYPLTAEEPKPLEEVASNDQFTTTANVEYPLTAEEPKQLEEVASNDQFTTTADLEYPLTAEEPTESEEVASKDPFTAAAELQYPLPVEEAKELEEVASNDPFSTTAKLEYPLTAEEPKEVEKAPAEQPKEVAMSSRAEKNIGGSLQKKTRVRKVLSGAEKTKTSTKYEDDPFVGKTVAFGRNATVGRSLVHQLGNKFDESGICYDLDNCDGHIVRTVLRKNKLPKSSKQIAANYNVIWEFTTFGESDLAGFVLLDGQKEGEKLLRKREHLKTAETNTSRARGKRAVRHSKSDLSKEKYSKNNLSKVLDDEANQVSCSTGWTEGGRKVT
jgi:hypothetical protein